MKKYLILFALILVQGCSSGGGDSAPATVDLIGMWGYELTTNNTVCDGEVATGIYDVQSLNGDVTKIGDIVVSGEIFFGDDISGLCVRGTITDEVDPGWSGRPAVMTAAQYLTFTNLDNAALPANVRPSVTINVFTSTQILQVDTLNNEQTITSLTR